MLGPSEAKIPFPLPVTHMLDIVRHDLQAALELQVALNFHIRMNRSAIDNSTVTPGVQLAV